MNELTNYIKTFLISPAPFSLRSFEKEKYHYPIASLLIHTT